MKDKSLAACAPVTLSTIREVIARDGLPYVAAQLRQKSAENEFSAIIASDFTAPKDCSGQLAGVPIGVKDNIDVLPYVTTGGSGALLDNLPIADAPVVARLRRAGAWFPAKLNLHELAFGVTSDNATFGRVRNPFDPSRTAGGSSGGSGVAVACGLMPIALGTDTGASVRIPAAFCGVVGLRPSTGRYPSGGMLTLSTTRDTIGVLGSTVADLSEIDAIIAPEDAADIVLPDRPIRMGLPEDALPGYSPVVEAHFREVLSRLVSLGVAKLVSIPAQDYASCEAELGLPLVFGEAMEFWVDFCNTRRGMLFPDFVKRISSPDVRAVFESLPELAEQTAEKRDSVVKGRRAALQARFGALFGRYGIDLVIAPTSPVQPPIIEEYTTMQTAIGPRDTMKAVSQNVAMATLVGAPSLSLPSGLDRDGLPVGMLLEGPIGSDRSVLAWAARVESCLS